MNNEFTVGLTIEYDGYEFEFFMPLKTVLGLATWESFMFGNQKLTYANMGEG